MPLRPRKKKKTLKLDGSSETHLLAGYCLISSCQICSGGLGMSRPLGLEPYTLNTSAKDVWERHKEKLLMVWRDPEGRGKGSGFCAEGLRGAGRLGLPTWAEIIFEEAKLPPLDNAWPPDVKKAWRSLKENRLRGTKKTKS